MAIQNDECYPNKKKKEEQQNLNPLPFEKKRQYAQSSVFICLSYSCVCIEEVEKSTFGVFFLDLDKFFQNKMQPLFFSCSSFFNSHLQKILTCLEI